MHYIQEMGHFRHNSLACSENGPQILEKVIGNIKIYCWGHFDINTYFDNCLCAQLVDVLCGVMCGDSEIINTRTNWRCRGLNQGASHMRSVRSTTELHPHSMRMGFEPTRAEHNGLAVHRLNHSATSSGALRRVNLFFGKANVTKHYSWIIRNRANFGNRSLWNMQFRINSFKTRRSKAHDAQKNRFWCCVRFQAIAFASFSWRDNIRCFAWKTVFCYTGD